MSVTDDPRKLAAQVALVSECRQLFGVRAARQLWQALCLPELAPGPTSALARRAVLEERVDAFIVQCLSRSGEFLAFRAIRDAHLAWCTSARFEPPSEKALATTLEQYGFAKDKIGGRMFYGARFSDAT